MAILSETDILNLTRLDLTKRGGRLWRNNVGATYTQNGAFFRYGLANESAHMNKKIKSSDLIGIKPVLITPDMIGHTVGQFVAREIKSQNWKFKGTDREIAQLNWLQLIISLGGDACFTTYENNALVNCCPPLDNTTRNNV